MPFIIVVLAILAVSVVGWQLWRRFARRLLAAASPDSFIMPQDPAWSLHGDVVRDRTLGIASAVNLRDIGGYPAQDGKRLKWGVVYRSGTLTELNAADTAALAALGIKLICDFRSAGEIRAAPDNPAAVGARYEPMPVAADQASLRFLRIVMFQPWKLRGLMRETYMDVILESNAALIGRFLTIAADEANLPLLFHCTAGKDRTGMAAMILMSLLGVPDEVIAADYSMSNRFYENFRIHIGAAVKKVSWLGMTADDVRPLMIADPALMREALAAVRAKYGSVEAYVMNRCEVDASTVAALRNLLLEDA